MGDRRSGFPADIACLRGSQQHDTRRGKAELIAIRNGGIAADHLKGYRQSAGGFRLQPGDGGKAEHTAVRRRERCNGLRGARGGDGAGDADR